MTTRGGGLNERLRITDMLSFSARNRALGLLALPLLVTACGAARDGGAPKTQILAANSEATRTGRSAYRQSMAHEGRRAELVGRWSPTLPPREARAVVTARAALAEPPDDKAFEAMTPTRDERVSYENLLKLRTTEPSSTHLSDVRRKLADYEGILIEISDTTIGWKTPNAPDVRQSYRVVAEEGDVVTLAAAAEQLDVRFFDKDHISMRSATRTFLLTRDSGIGADAASPVAAWNGATGRPGRTGSPTSSSITEVVPGPGAPSSAGGPKDTCTAYADCIDQMPRLKGTEGMMGTSSSTIRSWEKTADRLAQCKSAHELARAGGLCR